WFMWLRMPGLWPLFAFAGLRSYLSSMHVTRPLVVATVLANLANLLLDLLFIFGPPKMGAPGSGLATSICSFLMFGVMAIAARKAQPGLEVRRRISLPDLRKALRVGIPVGLQLGAEVGIFALVGVLAARLGSQSL